MLECRWESWKKLAKEIEKERRQCKQTKLEEMKWSMQETSN
jgi:hypothetical protein